METKESVYFIFWGFISIIFLNLGFNALHKTGLSASVSPVIMFLFKHIFAISTIHSSDYRLFNFVKMEAGWKDRKVQFHFLFFPLLTTLVTTEILSDSELLIFNPLILYFLAYSVCMLVTVLLLNSLMPGAWLAFHADCTIKMLLLGLGHSWKFMPLLVLLISTFTSNVWAEKFHDYETILPQLDSEHTDPTLTTKSTKMWKLIEFAMGTLLAALFQFFFHLTTVTHVLTFLYFAVTWLANLALLRPPSDLGIFNFLLGNVVVGSTMSRFELGGVTWLAYGVSVFLYGVRLMLK